MIGADYRPAKTSPQRSVSAYAVQLARGKRHDFRSCCIQLRRAQRPDGAVLQGDIHCPEGYDRLDFDLAKCDSGFYADLGCWQSLPYPPRDSWELLLPIPV